MNKSQKFWDQQAKNYAQSEDTYLQDYHEIVESTRKYLDVDDVVFDFACGTGILTIEIAERVKRIHAIDTSSGMIDIAIGKAEERGIENVNFVQSSLFDKRDDGKRFDALLAFNILHLLEDIPEIMQRINELLKPGGLFISATACMGEKRSFSGALISLVSRIGIVPYVKFFKIAELEDSIAKGHFQIIDVQALSSKMPTYCIVAKKL